MGRLKRGLAPAAAFFDRRVDWRLSRGIEERRLARQDDLNAVSDGLTKVYTDLLEATTDLRRWLADDLDAAQETAALLGRSLSRLSDAVEQVGEELSELVERVARLESALDRPTTAG